MSAPEIVSGMSGESENKIRALFATAIRAGPSIIFIDEIDTIAGKRDGAQREMEKRIVAQLGSSLDALADSDVHVTVIGATNRPDYIDAGLRRPGRFEREIEIPIPDEAARERILRVLCANRPVAPDCNFPLITRSTTGYVGADLAALAREATTIAIRRNIKNLLLPTLTNLTPTTPTSSSNNLLTVQSSSSLSSSISSSSSSSTSSSPSSIITARSLSPTY